MRKKRIDWTSTLFLTLTPVAAVVLTWLYFATETFNPWFLVMFAFFYTVSAVSITAGYHRLFSHKSYEAHWLLRLFYALFGAGAFQQSILKWAGDHRIHHRFVDTEKDPYNINEGFWHAHLLWMFFEDGRREEPSFQRYTMDLQRDKIVMLQDKYYVPLAIFMGFGLPMIIGYFMGSALGGLVFGGVLRLVFGHHFTFFINSLCHMWGKQTYTDQNTAKDNLALALFTFGEGYHNFHHFFHNDYRNGVKWYNWDPTKWIINGAKWMGLASRLRRVSRVEIEKARMAMVEKRLLLKSEGRLDAFLDHLQSLREKWEECGRRWEKAKSEYLELRRTRAKERCESRLEQMRALKRELRLARREMRLALQQWKSYSLHLRRVSLVRV